MLPRASADLPAAPIQATDLAPLQAPNRRAVLLGAGAALAAPLLFGAASASAATARHTATTRWVGTALAQGTRTTGPRFTETDPYGAKLTRTWDSDYWTSPWATTGFAAKQVITSWSVATPGATWAHIQVRVRTAGGYVSGWFSMGRWTGAGTGPTRRSTPGQSTSFGSVSVDTFTAAGTVTVAAWQVRVQLCRPAGSTVRPTLSSVGANASTIDTAAVPTSTPGVGRGRTIAVPTYSQMVHAGHYPELNGGGAAWCSATSMAMLVDYWRKGPSATETAWVRPTPHLNPQVDVAAKGIYDYAFGGTGNWSFSTAYAGGRGLDAFVTRLRSLAEAERFIAAGIPLGVSTKFTSTQLTGAGFSTAGHLMVIVGFTATGNVIVNDPASALKPSNGGVRKVYDRGQFENAVARQRGTTYVVRPLTTALPTPPAQRNW